MSHFESIGDWFDFAKYVKETNRYFLTDRWRDFIDGISETSKTRTRTLKKDYKLYRARADVITEQGTSGSVSYPVSLPLPLSEMGAPPVTQAKEGRLNPPGISYLYLSSNKETAIAEVRPWVGADLSLAEFRIVKDQKVIDARSESESMHETFKRLEKGDDPAAKEKFIWGTIDFSFSTPVSPNERMIEYIPTQYISEVLKNCGFHGILYQSSLGPGYNVLLFNPNMTEPINCELYRVEAVKYDAKKVDLTRRSFLDVFEEYFRTPAT